MVICAGILLGTLCIAILSQRSQQQIGFNARGFPNVDQVRELVRSLGYDAIGTDSTWGLAWNKDYFQSMQSDEQAWTGWKRLTGRPPTAANFWYRVNSDNLVPERGHGPFAAMFVTPDDPPPQRPGMIRVVMDADGKLIELLVPPTAGKTQRTSRFADDSSHWRTKLLTAAGLDSGVLKSETVPLPNTAGHPPPPVYADAWEGWQSKSNRIVVQAAAYKGRPVFFRIAPEDSGQHGGRSRILQIILAATLFVTFTLAVVLARRNWLSGRADRRGATRMFIFILVVSFLYWLFQAHHVASGGELVMILKTSARALLRGFLICAAYVGLEPFVRRLWPHSLIGWNRLLRGRLTDPVVARDILIGTAGGVSAQLVASAGLILGTGRQIALLADPVLSIGSGPFDLQPLMGPQSALGQICAELFVALVGGFVACPLLYFLVRTIVRKDSLAAIVFVLFFSMPALVRGDFAGAITVAVWSAMSLYFFFRFGVLTVTVAWVTWRILAWPVTLDLTGPYLDIGLLAFLLVVAIAVANCVICLRAGNGPRDSAMLC